VSIYVSILYAVLYDNSINFKLIDSGPDFPSSVFMVYFITLTNNILVIYLSTFHCVFLSLCLCI